MNKYTECAYVGVAAFSITLALGSTAAACAPDAHADPSSTNYCTPETPYAPYNGVCTGYASYCFLGLNCSTVYGEPGTWNPGGYTPPVYVPKPHQLPPGIHQVG